MAERYRLRKRTKSVSSKEDNDNNNTNTNITNNDNKNNNNNDLLAYKCEKCASVFSRKYKLQQHQRIKHQHQCEICLKLYNSSQALSRHELTHFVPSFRCQTCEKKFSRPDTLQAHERSAHIEFGMEKDDMIVIEISRQCHRCEGWVLSDPLRNEYFRELRKQRLGLPHILPSVLPPSQSDTTWQRHQIIISTGGTAYHQCTVCYKLLKGCPNHREHQKKCHTPAIEAAKKGYQCPKCSRLFSCRKTLKKHCSKTCPALSENFLETLSSPYRCNICFKHCKNSKGFKNHQTTHSAAARLKWSSNPSTSTSTTL